MCLARPGDKVPPNACSVCALQNNSPLRYNYLIIDLFFIQVFHYNSESGLVRIERKHPQVIEIILGCIRSASSTGPRAYM